MYKQGEFYVKCQIQYETSFASGVECIHRRVLHQVSGAQRGEFCIRNLVHKRLVLHRVFAAQRDEFYIWCQIHSQAGFPFSAMCTKRLNSKSASGTWYANRRGLHQAHSAKTGAQVAWAGVGGTDIFYRRVLYPVYAFTSCA